MTDASVADPLQSQKAAVSTVEQATGFKPLADRKLGTAKLLGFHIVNLVTAGIFGQFAKACSDMQVMGSQKNTFWQRHHPLKDIGQTYLNATVGRDYTDYEIDDYNGKKTSKTFWGEKNLRKATKAWSEGLGSVTGFLIQPLTELTGSNQRLRLQAKFRQNFHAQFGRYPSAEVLKGMSTEKLFEMGRADQNVTLDGVKAECKSILDRKKELSQSDKLDPTLEIKDIENGSVAMQTEFTKHVASEYSVETLYYKDWAEKAVAGVDGAEGALINGEVLRNPQSTYQLSKLDMLAAYTQLIRQGAELEVNISSTNRENWTNLFQQHLTSFQRRWNQKVQQHQHYKQELSIMAKGSPEYTNKLMQIRQVESQLEALKEQKFSPDVSRQFGKEMQDSYTHIIALIQSSAVRFGNNLQ